MNAEIITPLQIGKGGFNPWLKSVNYFLREELLLSGSLLLLLLLEVL
jgi:hypothetical protein